MKHLRVYADTSVIGGYFDEKFAEESRTLLDMVREKKMTFIVSDLLIEELELAPEKIQREFASLPKEFLEAIRISNESQHLCNAYLKAKVVSEKHINDAHHVALATIAHADLIVSWNFKHIVHFDKIRGFNAINLQQGYSTIEIRSPKEVV